MMAGNETQSSFVPWSPLQPNISGSLTDSIHSTHTVKGTIKNYYHVSKSDSTKMCEPQL